MDNPCPSWLADSSWDNITELNKLPNFQGIMTSFEQYPRDWNLWYTSAEPENVTLPGLNILLVEVINLFNFILHTVTAAVRKIFSLGQIKLM